MHKDKSTMDRFLNILREKQPTPEEIVDEEKLRFIASKISIWDFFGIPQTNYLALSKDEKSRMFNDYYEKLVLKYFSVKNIFCFFFHYLRLFEMLKLPGM